MMKDYREDLEPKFRVKCNFYNQGFCRQGSSCEYEHPVNVCEQYLKEGECLKRHCNGRHIYKCRYFQSPQGCFRGNSCIVLREQLLRDWNSGAVLRWDLLAPDGSDSEAPPRFSSDRFSPDRFSPESRFIG